MDSDDEDEPPIGPEGDLIPEMVSRAVVPLLIKAFENGAYDPYSAPQTRRAIDLADLVSDLTGKDSRKYTVSHFLLEVVAVLSIPVVPESHPYGVSQPHSRARYHGPTSKSTHSYSTTRIRSFFTHLDGAFRPSSPEAHQEHLTLETPFAKRGQGARHENHQ